MEILIKELRELLLKNGFKDGGGLNIGDFKVGIQHGSLKMRIYENEEQDTLQIRFKGLLGTSENFKYLPNDHIFLTGQREDIIKAVKGSLKLIANAKEIDDLDEHFSDLKENQDIVMDYYKLYFGLTSEDEAALHMFFSPTRVVLGLTLDEVRECIDMYPKREQQKKLYPDMYPPHLDFDLIKNPDENISRTEGLRKAINQILSDLKNNKPIIYS